MEILVVNPGSSSRKFAWFSGGRPVASAHMEASADGARAYLRGRGATRERPLTPEEYAGGTRVFLEFAASAGAGTAEDLDAVALRIVAPGTYFQRHRLVDGEFIRRLENAAQWAPLHVRPALDDARRLREDYPRLGLIGVSDSAFHASLPEYRRRYALPAGDADRWDLFRFGYHGISVQAVLREAGALGPEGPRAIVCHLGGGCSVTAVRGGRSVDTSMGFSPLEGLIMGTRPGDLDPGAVIYLAKAAGMDPDRLEDYLNRRCGLLGLSGISSDLRDVSAREAEGDAGARLALDAFADRARKYIGAYFAVLGGLDLLIFTGGIGEGAVEMRRRICAGLEGSILQGGSDDPRVRVIASDEMGEMARLAAEFAGKPRPG